jgi:hypothetical protein
MKYKWCSSWALLVALASTLKCATPYATGGFAQAGTGFISPLRMRPGLSYHHGNRGAEKAKALGSSSLLPRRLPLRNFPVMSTLEDRSTSQQSGGDSQSLAKFRFFGSDSPSETRYDQLAYAFIFPQPHALHACTRLFSPEKTAMDSHFLAWLLHPFCIANAEHVRTLLCRPKAIQTGPVGWLRDVQQVVLTPKIPILSRKRD